LHKVSSSFNPNKLENYLLAFQLLFYSYANKNYVWSNLEKLGMHYYVHAPEIQAMNYLETLPSYLYSIHSYSQNETEMGLMLGFPMNFLTEIKYIHTKVVTSVQINYSLEHKVVPIH